MTRLPGSCRSPAGLTLQGPAETIAVVPMEKPNALTQKALQTASGLSRRIQVLHIKQENIQCDFLSEWNRNGQHSVEQAGFPEPKILEVTETLDAIYQRAGH